MTPEPVCIDQMLDALEDAESFISGFEDDESQEGVVEMLARIRAAITAAKAILT
jgi:hypothetical protein